MFRKISNKPAVVSSENQQIESQSSAASINAHVPKDILLEIFKLLGSIDLRHAVRVCKQWHNMIMSADYLKAQFKVIDLVTLGTFKQVQSLVYNSEKSIVFMSAVPQIGLIKKLKNEVVEATTSPNYISEECLGIGSKLQLTMHDIPLNSDSLDFVSKNNDLLILCVRQLNELQPSFFIALETQVNQKTPILILNVTDDFEAIKSQKISKKKVQERFAYYTKGLADPTPINIIGYLGLATQHGLQMDALVKIIYDQVIKPAIDNDLAIASKQTAKKKKCSIM